jgi:hypothetical protein
VGDDNLELIKMLKNEGLGDNDKGESAKRVLRSDREI